LLELPTGGSARRRFLSPKIGPPGHRFFNKFERLFLSENRGGFSPGAKNTLDEETVYAMSAIGKFIHNSYSIILLKDAVNTGFQYCVTKLPMSVFRTFYSGSREFLLVRGTFPKQFRRAETVFRIQPNSLKRAPHHNSLHHVAHAISKLAEKKIFSFSALICHTLVRI
jgi:hypothetical protein